MWFIAPLVTRVKNYDFVKNKPMTGQHFTGVWTDFYHGHSGLIMQGFCESELIVGNHLLHI